MKRCTKGSISIVMCMFMFFAVMPYVEALNFATYPLEELAEQSDTIIIGTVVSKKGGASENYDKYQVSIDQVVIGNVEEGSQISVNVLQWSDEGILESGKRYLLLLNANSGLYEISGVHQGFIRIEGGRTVSRFYSQDEVERFLADNDIELTSRPIPGNREAQPVDNGSDQYVFPVLIAVIVLIGIALPVGLLYKRRMK
ncbi:hypothetical protein AB6A23_12330 [Paenibacillus tarimensis]